MADKRLKMNTRLHFNDMIRRGSEVFRVGEVFTNIPTLMRIENISRRLPTLNWFVCIDKVWYFRHGRDDWRKENTEL